MLSSAQTVSTRGADGDRLHPGGRRRKTLTDPRTWTPWMFLLPALIFAAVFKFIPMLAGFEMSVSKVQPFLGNEFVGLDNYIEVLTDERFLRAAGQTLLLGVGETVGSLAIGFLLALLLEGQTRSLWFARTAVFLPVVTAGAVVAELWRLIYYPTGTGLLNQVLGSFGAEPSLFLNDPDTALLSVMAVGIWIGAPYNMVILLAGLAGIDRNLYEAATVDGANLWHRLRYIVLPGLRPAISVVLTLAAIRALRVFTLVYVLTGGGPAGSTEVWMTRVYSLGFDQNDLGVAAAASTVLLLVTLILTLITRSVTNRKSPV